MSKYFLFCLILCVSAGCATTPSTQEPQPAENVTENIIKKEIDPNILLESYEIKLPAEIMQLLEESEITTYQIGMAEGELPPPTELICPGYERQTLSAYLSPGEDNKALDAPIPPRTAGVV